MKLIIKQKLLSWFDSYNVYDENDNIIYVVKGKLSWGHKFLIFDSNGNEVGCVNEKIFTIMPTFEVFNNGFKIGQIKKKFTFIKPKYYFDLGEFDIVGDIWGLNYSITKYGKIIATINEKFFSLTDTYIIETSTDDALNVLLIVLAIDADKCNKKNN